MSRANLIGEIVELRQPLAQRIERVLLHFKSIKSDLEALQTKRDEILGRTRDTQTANNLSSLDFRQLQQEITGHRSVLERLKERFSRPTLNIGVVGRARQGKSRLLQSLTGLSRQEIPDGSQGHCTGVRSTIYHQPDVTTHGKVSFHTEQSFLKQVIAPYYAQLKLGSTPGTIQEFARTFLGTSLPENIAALAGSQAMFDHLRRYHECLSKYGALIGTPDLTIEQSQIREYVAQDNLDGERIYFNYLAVKEVKIICQFPNQDIGQVALVDMPGLGDTGTGDEQRLIRTLGQGVDIILLVRMPKPKGDHWDKQLDLYLYDTAGNAIPELPLEL